MNGNHLTQKESKECIARFCSASSGGVGNKSVMSTLASWWPMSYGQNMLGAYGAWSSQHVAFLGGLSWAYLGIFIPISERVTTPVSWKTDRLFDSIIFISSCFTGHLPHISRSRRGFLQHLLAWNMPRYANACNMPRLRTCLNAEHQQTSAVGLVGCWGQFVVSTWAMNGQLMDSYIMDA